MTNFKAYVKIDGAWEEITPLNNKCKGQPVFPLTYGQMLDERLNEAYLHVRKCSASIFHPDTEFRIDVIENVGVIGEDEKTTSFYYIVARDNAIERPIGSGMYRHEIYLIERTKKLEGIICQSITFTNPKGNVYTDAAQLLPSVNTVEILSNEGYTSQGSAEPFKITSYKNPIASGALFRVEPISSIIDQTDFWVTTGYKLKISDGINSENYNGDQANEAHLFSVLGNNLQITYEFSGQYAGIGESTYHYTVSFSFSVVENRYPIRPYTIADCIDRCLLLAEPLFGNEQPRYSLDPSQREKYAAIYAPQFSMTQCTLREQLKVIGGYIHAEPRLTEDDYIHFDDLGEGEEWEPSEPYVFNQQSQDINEYCTSVDTSASNIINSMDYAQGVIYSPNSADVLTVRTESVYARVNEENGFAYTQFPIYDVVKVECGVFNEGDGGFFIEPVDITPYVFEEAEYTANLSSFQGQFPNAKQYAIYYKRGANNIRGLFFKPQNVISASLEFFSIVNILSTVTGKSEGSIRNELTPDGLNGDGTAYASGLCFRISYIPYYSTRFAHGKQYVDEIKDNFTKIYNQSENLIETRYYGENIKGVAMRLGNVEQTRTYRFSSLASVPQIGQTLDGYAISAVNVSVLPTSNFGIKITVALSKDFNRISQYVGIQSRKRTYEVSESEAYQRNVLIREYCVIGKEMTYPLGAFRYPNALICIFKNTEGLTPISAASSCRDGIEGSGTLLPVVSSSFGNVMTFSWSYKDNYSAGDRLAPQTLNNASGYFQNDVPYCDYYGRISEYSFNLLSKEYYSDNNTKEEALNLPRKSYIEARGSGISTDYNGNYKMMKDSREVINMNFALEFKSNIKSIIVGSALAANCPLVRNMEGQAERFTPLLFALNSKVGKFQQRITEALTNGITFVSGGDNTVYIEIPASFQNTPWAICLPQTTEQKTYDKNGTPETVTEKSGGDILLACNEPAKFWAEADVGSNGSRRIYLNLARTIYN